MLHGKAEPVRLRPLVLFPKLVIEVQFQHPHLLDPAPSPEPSALLALALLGSWCRQFCRGKGSMAWCQLRGCFGVITPPPGGG